MKVRKRTIFISAQRARKLKKNSWNQRNQFFFREIAFLAVLNFSQFKNWFLAIFEITKNHLQYILNCQKCNFTKKIIIFFYLISRVFFFWRGLFYFFWSPSGPCVFFYCILSELLCTNIYIFQLNMLWKKQNFYDWKDQKLVSKISTPLK